MNTTRKTFLETITAGVAALFGQTAKALPDPSNKQELELPTEKGMQFLVTVRDNRTARITFRRKDGTLDSQDVQSGGVLDKDNAEGHARWILNQAIANQMELIQSVVLGVTFWKPWKTPKRKTREELGVEDRKERTELFSMLPLSAAIGKEPHCEFEEFRRWKADKAKWTNVGEKGATPDTGSM